MALRFGATDKVFSDANTISEIMCLTGGTGVDVAIEAVGIPQTFELCQEIIAPGGRIANVGVHGNPSNLIWKVMGKKHCHHHQVG